MTGTKTARDVSGEIAYLTRALKAPTLRESAGRLAERARSESWSHEEYLAACLQREVAARDLERQRRELAARVPSAMVVPLARAANRHREKCQYGTRHATPDYHPQTRCTR